MRKFDLTIILSVGLEKTEQEKALAKIKKMIEDTGGKVAKVDEWGKRVFAYQIKKQKEGIYFNLSLELEAKEVKAIEEKLRLDEKILRYLLVRKE